MSIHTLKGSNEEQLMNISILRYIYLHQNQNIREITPNVPQFCDFDKCSSGSRILRSQSDPGLSGLDLFLKLASQGKFIFSSDYVLEIYAAKSVQL